MIVSMVPKLYIVPIPGIIMTDKIGKIIMRDEKIAEMLNEGYTYMAIAKALKCSKRDISRVKKTLVPKVVPKKVVPGAEFLESAMTTAGRLSTWSNPTIKRLAKEICADIGRFTLQWK